MNFDQKIQPRLIVRGADEALAFYVRAFGASLVERYVHEGQVVHAELDFGGFTVQLTESAPHWHNHAPDALGGTPVLLSLGVEDAFATEARLLEAGCQSIFPVADQFYGSRDGRLRDPYGHVWILTQPIEDLGPEQI